MSQYIGMLGKLSFYQFISESVLEQHDGSLVSDLAASISLQLLYEP